MGFSPLRFSRHPPAPPEFRGLKVKLLYKTWVSPALRFLYFRYTHAIVGADAGRTVCPVTTQRR